MMIANEDAARVAQEPRPHRSAARLFGWCLVRTWVLTACGGAICAALAFNVVSLAFFFLAMPLGFLLVAVYGIPVIVPLAWWVSRQRPRPDPTRFVRTLQIVGASLAVVVNGTTNVNVLVQVARPYPSAPPMDPWAIVGLTLLTMAFVAASGFVGWSCGATLAQRYLVATGHPAAKAREIERRWRPWR